MEQRMTEEVVVPNDEPIKPAEIYTIEDQAKDQGWVPKDEFQGDETKWVDAGEFIRRGELFKKIDQVNKVAKNAERQLVEFKKHYAKVKQTEFDNALATLKAERRAAKRDGDFDREELLETQIELVEKDKETTLAEVNASTGQEVEVHPEVAQWVEKNKWYNEDLPMKAYADTVAQQLNKQGISGPALLKGIEEEIRKVFPNKFTNPNRQRPGATESTSRGSSREASFELSEQEQNVMKTLTSGPHPVMTKEEYIRDLKKIKGVK
jgi:hypothetical protein